MKKFLFLLLLSVGLYAQEPVFSTTQDTINLIDATAETGRWIYFNNPMSEGMATLFVAGDSVSGATPDVTVEYQMYFGAALNGDLLHSEWFTLGTVEDGKLIETYGDGTLVGETFILPDDTEWTYCEGVRFRFTGSGTANTILVSVLKWR